MNNPYFDAPGLSSGQLARFWNGGQYSPDMALIKIEPKSIFEIGNAFEALCYDKSHGARTFFDTFFISEESGDVPEKITKAVKDGWDSDRIKTLEKLNKPGKDGERKRSEAKGMPKLHAMIDECIANPGKMPISNPDFGMLNDLAEKMCEMPMPEDHPLFGAGWKKVGEILEMEKTEWQYPIYWNSPMSKKALPDLFLLFPGQSFIFDLKWTSKFSKFVQGLKSRYWIQDIHYQESAQMTFGVPCAQMMFLVGSGEEPGLCQIIETDQENRKYQVDEYERLCVAYQSWLDAGQPKKGYLEKRKVKVWI